MAEEPENWEGDGVMVVKVLELQSESRQRRKEGQYS